ncbi:MAG TPA: VC1465 family Xer recombination activation factor [Rhodanobacteraceae bacterium]|nr:VC1465 family Xer recombination activation factor [Rhodanobacteraceae bacterium]
MRPRRRRLCRLPFGGFRELRLTCLLSRDACAKFLGVSPRTVRYWEAGRYRVPWSAVRLLRLVRTGDLGALAPEWEGFELHRDVLRTPEGYLFTRQDFRAWWWDRQRLAHLLAEREAATVAP